MLFEGRDWSAWPFQDANEKTKSATTAYDTKAPTKTTILPGNKIVTLMVALGWKSFMATLPVTGFPWPAHRSFTVDETLNFSECLQPLVDALSAKELEQALDVFVPAEQRKNIEKHNMNESGWWRITDEDEAEFKLCPQSKYCYGTLAVLLRTRFVKLKNVA